MMEGWGWGDGDGEMWDERMVMDGCGMQGWRWKDVGWRWRDVGWRDVDGGMGTERW